jgi:hypothetical protein
MKSFAELETKMPAQHVTLDFGFAGCESASD